MSVRLNFVKIVLTVVLLSFVLSNSLQAKEGPYEPKWNSLSAYNVPEWFKDAKFGLYTHWGPYSVPACGPLGCWYPHNMYRKGTEQYEFHVKNYGTPEEFGYKDFVPLFTAKKFDADEWAELFKQAGARFAGPVAEHHDGFAMWDSKYSEWNAMKMGPKRDVVGELEKAIKGRGMKFVTTFHHSTKWGYFPVWDERFDCSDPQYSGLYGPIHSKNEKPNALFLDEFVGKIKEVIGKYRPDLIWFDWGLGRMQESYVKDFFAYYYNSSVDWEKEVIVAYKGHTIPPVTGVVDYEDGRTSILTYYVWMTDMCMGDPTSWSHVAGQKFKSADHLVDILIDIVSKNGVLLLNVGPKADGIIPETAKQRLLDMGKWLKINGEAIYGTRPWTKYGEGPSYLEGVDEYNIFGGPDEEPDYSGKDIRFTVKNNVLYAIALGWPGKELVIRTLRRWAPQEDDEKGEIKSITMLGDGKKLEWKFSEKGLTIKTPKEKPCEHAFVFKIERHFNVNQLK